LSEPFTLVLPLPLPLLLLALLLLLLGLCAVLLFVLAGAAVLARL
jgi:hypothetical protein